MFDEADKKIYKKYFSSANQFISTNDLLLSTHLHPHGIKEILEPRQSRIAKSILVLFNALEKDSINERLSALHSMRDELMFCADNASSMNTARVLLALVKDLVRETRPKRKLELLHDFTLLTHGRPSLVRKYLEKYNLLEMPEEWNQIAFDHHVHDSYTTGRKTPTRIVMDSFIKGIRELTVIYYMIPSSEAVRELFTAAYYMRMTVHIAVEFSVTFRSKMVEIIWEPKNIIDENQYIAFTERKEVKKIASLTQKICKYRSETIFTKIDQFNVNSLKDFNRFYDIKSEPVLKDEFLLYIGQSLPSLEILAGFICRKTYPLIKERLENLEETSDKTSFKHYVQKIHSFSSEFIMKTFLHFAESVFQPVKEKAVPELIKLTPGSLIKLIENAYSSNNITLNLGGLSFADVIEILYEGKGSISHIEIYNYRNSINNRMPDTVKIEKFEQCINNRYVADLIQLIKEDCLLPLEREISMHSPDSKKINRQIAAVKNIMNHTGDFFKFYKTRKIKDKWGSDSTGWTAAYFGSGFALLETLPKRISRNIEKKYHEQLLSVSIQTAYYKIYGNVGYKESLSDLLNWKHKNIVWISDSNSNNRELPNLIALGKKDPADPNRTDNFFNDYAEKSKKKKKVGCFLKYFWHYMPTDAKNWIKIGAGFVPAFLTFFLTSDWPFLMYFGAVIWFAITGIRNIFQAILGGDSFKHSQLLHWKNYIDWARIADSLFFSGWSVPLLDYLAKTVILYRGFHVSISENPLVVYSVMSVLNGMYIVSHNILRGFDKKTTFFNFFRSIIAIPVAFALSSVTGGVLIAFGITDTADILQKWAAVITKFAGDLIGGFIEGFSLYRKNIRLRKIDYQSKMIRFTRTCSDIELLYAEKNLFTGFSNKKDFFKDLQKKNPDLIKLLVYDALDFLYFWEYQPYSRPVIKHLFYQLSEKEQKDFLFYQQILREQKMIQSLMSSGVLGKNYKKTKFLYASKTENYLNSIQNFKRIHEIAKT